MGDGDASPALRLTGHGPGSDPEGWVGGRWSIRAGWGSCPRFRKCQAAGLEAALLPLCPPGCRLPGTELSTWDQGRVGRMFGYKMGPWFGEGSSLRPLHPGPGLSPQLCSTKLVGGRQLYLCLVTGGPWFPASSSRFRRPSRAQAEPGGAVGPGLGGPLAPPPPIFGNLFVHRHSWSTVHCLPGAKSGSDHPRTLPPNSSADN